MAEIKKRFIAGAVCPSCGQLDKIRAWRDEDLYKRECVSCDFRDETSFQLTPSEQGSSESPTEVENGAEVRVLKFPDS